MKKNIALEKYLKFIVESLKQIVENIKSNENETFFLEEKKDTVKRIWYVSHTR